MVWCLWSQHLLLYLQQRVLYRPHRAGFFKVHEPCRQPRSGRSFFLFIFLNLRNYRCCHSLRQYQLRGGNSESMWNMMMPDGSKFSRLKFRMYTKWWTAATFLLTRIYLCVNNGHNKNFNPVFIIFRYIWITFINIIHYKCIVLLSILSPSV